ncbi:MAG: MFS transporter [Gammaproteobacteria bacterium]|nr:MFS transporter [Gammaproteobacteria bacterium]
MQQEHYPTAPEDRIPLSQKIAFGAGMLGNQMFPAALAIFMVVLVQGLGINPVLWGILFFVPRLVDAVTDPFMGFISDNTRSRWGRRRPYIFVGAIIAGLSFIVMWQLYPENGELYNFTYFLLTSIVFYIGLTVFSTPYVAMGYEMSNDFHERTRLMAVAQWIGQWAWVIVPWFWVLIYDPDMFGSAAEGARVLSVWVGLGCLCLAIVPAFFCKTLPVRDEDMVQLSRENVGDNVRTFLAGFAETFRNAPFRRLCIATFLVFNAFNTVAGFSWFIIVYYMNNGDAAVAGTWPAWFGTLSALSTCFLVIPIVTWLAQRIGKKNTFLFSQAVSILGYAMFWWCFQPERPLLMFLPLPLFAFGIGGLFTLMMSMTADVCDLDELRTGSRREGTFAAIYWWMVKFGLAVAGLLSGLILNLVGFDQDVAAQTPSALAGLRLAYIIVPTTGTVLAILIMLGYDLSEQRAHEIREQLEARRGKLAVG